MEHIYAHVFISVCLFIQHSDREGETKAMQLRKPKIRLSDSIETDHQPPLQSTVGTLGNAVPLDGGGKFCQESQCYNLAGTSTEESKRCWKWVGLDL